MAECFGMDEPLSIGVFFDELRSLGNRVERVNAYETFSITEGHNLELGLIEAKEISCVIFTSSGEVMNFLTCIDGIQDALEQIVIACFGPKCTDYAIDNGLKVNVSPTRTLSFLDLVQALEDYCSANPDYS